MTKTVYMKYTPVQFLEELPSAPGQSDFCFFMGVETTEPRFVPVHGIQLPGPDWDYWEFAVTEVTTTPQAQASGTVSTETGPFAYGIWQEFRVPDNFPTGVAPIGRVPGTNDLQLAIDGTTGDDTLVWRSGIYSISGYEGNDRIIGGNGAGVLGAVNIYAGPGDDVVIGGSGTEWLHGDEGNDRLNGGPGDDNLTGGSGADLFAMSPGGGRDTILDFNPQEGDRIDLSAFRDIHDFAELLRVYAFGDLGDHVAQFGLALEFSGFKPITSISINGFENNSIPASSFIFYPPPLTAFGTIGNDAISGGGGDDILLGQNGNDTIGGEAGDDRINGGSGNDVIFGGAGNDELGGGPGDDTIVGQDGNDVIFGEDGNDQANGGTGNDTMIGGAGNDTFGGGSEEDVIIGGDGNDLLFGESGFDSINGGIGDDGLIGGAGDDILGAGDGNDIVVGDDGNDVLFGETGNDAMNGGFGNDILIGSDGDDVLGGGAGDDDINGGFGNDTLFGENGNDILNGSAGNDILIGGGNDDTFVFQPGDGADTIGDFFAGGPEDRIWFKGTDLHTFADVQAHTTFNAAAGTATITYNGFFTVTLNGVAAGQLTAGDFIFS